MFFFSHEWKNFKICQNHQIHQINGTNSPFLLLSAFLDLIQYLSYGDKFTCWKGPWAFLQSTISWARFSPTPWSFFKSLIDPLLRTESISLSFVKKKRDEMSCFTLHTIIKPHQQQVLKTESPYLQTKPTGWVGVLPINGLMGMCHWMESLDWL